MRAAFPSRPHLLAATIALLLSVPGAMAQATDATPRQAAPASRDYDLPAQPLSASLVRIAGEGGVRVSVDADLVRDLSAPTLQGRYTPEAALQQVLVGSGLELARTGSGVFTVRRGAAPSVGTAAAAAAPAVPAAPAAEGATVELPGITVLAEAERTAASEGSGSYAAKAVSIGKTTQSLREIPQSVSVLTNERIEAQNLTSLEDAMFSTTGVTVTMADPDRVSYYSRGFQVDTLQYDGMGFSPSPSTGGMLVQPDLAMFDRVEVLRGSAGLLQGSGNPSAAVNLVRKRPLPAFAGEVSVAAGTWDAYRATADLSAPLNAAGTVRGRVVAAVDDRKFFQNARMEKRQTVYGVVEADLGPRTLLTLGATYQDQDTTGSWYGLPSTATGAVPTYFPRETYLGGAWNRWSRDNTSAFAELEHKFDSGWTVKGSLNTLRMDLDDFRQSVHSGAYNAATGKGLTIEPGTDCNYADQQSGWEVLGSGPFSLFGRRHELLLGASERNDRVFTECSFMKGPSYAHVNPFAWDPYAMPEPPATVFPGAYARIETREKGAYATARFNVADPLTVILGARASWYEWRNAQFGNNGLRTSLSGYEVKREITPYAGVVYALDDQHSAYASYADIFKPQNVVDRNGDVLDPVSGTSLEVGVKGEYLNKRVNASLALFRIVQNNRAQSDLDGPSPCPHSTGGTPAQYCSVAEGKTRSQGFEAEVSGEVARGLQLFAGYTYNTTAYVRDRSNAEGTVFHSQTPRHILRLGANYRLPGAWNAWTVGGSLRSQSGAYNASGSGARAKRAEQGGYTVASLQASYQVNPAVSVALNVNNVFDKVYFRQISPGTANFYGDPRNATLTLRATF